MEEKYLEDWNQLPIIFEMDNYDIESKLTNVKELQEVSAKASLHKNQKEFLK